MPLKDKGARLAYYRAYTKRRYAEVTKVILAAKDRPCADCGQEYPSYVMDFHHRDPKTKSFDVSKAHTRSLKSLRAEIAKCDVLCANCHRIREHS